MNLNAPAELAFERIYGHKPADDLPRWTAFISGWNEACYWKEIN